MSYMDMAITAGKKARGISNPNPPVGAVIVKGDQVISEGFTRKPGSPHAEKWRYRRQGKMCETPPCM